MNAFAAGEPVRPPPSDPISIQEFVAFSQTIADAKAFPYNVRAIVFDNPNRCFESPKCARAKLFLAITGDGELPDYRVFDAGDAANWAFMAWPHTPTEFFDDERDFFILELRKTIPCSSDDCGWETRKQEIVRAKISMFGFEWLR
ncbi:MAG: hypothetical protein WD076_06260 [Parvularculaceae bacterium]